MTSMPSFRLAFWVTVGGVVVGVAAGVLAGAKPLYLGLALGAVVVIVYFFADLKRAVLGLLILRSSLDIFSLQQIPAVFALGLDGLTLLYVTVLLLTGRTVRTDRFWWFFAGWVMLQSQWLILSYLGGLGLGSEVLPLGIREWIRLFSWLMVYLLVMQLQDRLHPQQIISVLFLSLIAPVTVGLMQLFLPSSRLPSLIASGAEEYRINGTLGLSNTFATYLLLFMGLSWWKLSRARRRLSWALLLCLLSFMFVGTKALFSLAMLGVFVLVLIAPKLNLPNAIGGLLLLVVVLGLFASSEFGTERLSTISDTPLLNPNLDVSRAILLSKSDYNSFNWRLAQWTYLLQSWQNSPILGHGLATSVYLSPFQLFAHNDYIRALAEQGLVGLVTFLAFLGAQVVRLVQLLRDATRRSAQHDLCWILLAIFLATLVGMVTENIWSHTTLYFYWWTLLAVAGWSWNESEPSENPAPTEPVKQPDVFHREKLVSPKTPHQ